MRSVRQRDTTLERDVRRYLHAHGVRFRVCPPSLPGRPDVVNRARGWALFIHGCFWHGHEDCVLARLPRTNEAFWRQKLRDNRARDARKEAQLRELGLRVFVVWQCWTRDPERLAKALSPIVRLHGGSGRHAARSPSR
jgi:DNA mismatch endonuclease (patch repair protein)